LLAKLKVKQIMTRDLLTAIENMTIGEAAKIMLENKVSGLPVVESSGNLAGIITESDIFRMVVQAWQDD
jgi:acetoin utilization protein AcuB